MSRDTAFPAKAINPRLQAIHAVYDWRGEPSRKVSFSQGDSVKT
jgi:hypothetical protein